MLTPQALEVAFSVHDLEMKRCEGAGCFWALLHLVLAYPDVCSGLEVPDPNTNIRSRYGAWCEKWLNGARTRKNGPSAPTLSGDDWWGMRNKVLHQGSAVQAAGRTYARFSFSRPPANDHNTVGPPDMLHFEVLSLANEMRAAVADWRAALLAAPMSPIAAMVEQKISRIAVEYIDQEPAPAPAPSAAGSVPGYIEVLKTN